MSKEAMNKTDEQATAEAQAEHNRLSGGVSSETNAAAEGDTTEGGVDISQPDGATVETVTTTTTEETVEGGDAE